MTSGNSLPAILLALFLVTGTECMDAPSFGYATPRAALHGVLVTLSDPLDSIGHMSNAFESVLNLRRSAETFRASLLRLRHRGHVELQLIVSDLENQIRPVAATLLDEAAYIVDRDAARRSSFRRPVVSVPVNDHIDTVSIQGAGQAG